jgi:hypothetical protein
LVSGNRSLRHGERGAVLIEFTAVFLLFITLLFGVIEFSYAFYQWNAATKAMQLGARYAAVSDPVMLELPEIDGLAATTPGEPLVGTYDVVCVGKTEVCVCTGSECPSDASYVGASMDGIVATMRRVFPRITKDNVTVRYEYTKLGYAGRPGGPVPTITVSLNGLNFEFILLSAFFTKDSVPMPNFATTVTGEDLMGS